MVRRLHARADRLLRGQGLSRGDVAARLRALAGDGRWLYPEDAAGKSRAVADMNATLAAIRPRLPQAFGALPAPPAEVRRLTDDEEAVGRQGYRAEARGDDPAVYYVDLSRIRRRPAWTLPSVVHHELIPGHLLQSAAAAPPHPLQARYAGGYSEGWAVYAEMVADDLGAFSGDPRAELGYLQWLLFRLARVVADTGVHALGWSRARAAAEMRRIQGDDIAFVTIAEDVDRICMQPASAAAQGVLAMELRRLGMRRTLGRPAFHAAVLRHGPLGLTGLRKAVELAERRTS